MPDCYTVTDVDLRSSFMPLIDSAMVWDRSRAKMKAMETATTRRRRIKSPRIMQLKGTKRLEVCSMMVMVTGLCFLRTETWGVHGMFWGDPTLPSSAVPATSSAPSVTALTESDKTQTVVDKSQHAGLGTSSSSSSSLSRDNDKGGCAKNMNSRSRSSNIWGGFGLFNFYSSRRINGCESFLTETDSRKGGESEFASGIESDDQDVHGGSGSSMSSTYPFFSSVSLLDDVTAILKAFVLSRQMPSLLSAPLLFLGSHLVYPFTQVHNESTSMNKLRN